MSDRAKNTNAVFGIFEEERHHFLFSKPMFFLDGMDKELRILIRQNHYSPMKVLAHEDAVAPSDCSQDRLPREMWRGDGACESRNHD